MLLRGIPVGLSQLHYVSHRREPELVLRRYAVTEKAMEHQAQRKKRPSTPVL